VASGAGHPGSQAGVRKADPGRDGDDLQGAVFSSAVALDELIVDDRDVRPGQVTHLGVQGGLVALDDECVPAVVAVQVGGVGPLGVQRVGSDHHVG